jgi:NADP-dependent 3-hydroxy acid dehydrogenase YdfG
MSSTLPEDTALSFGPVLAQKTALVTGASRGIGRAIASLLGGLGASVVICARSKDIETTAEALRAKGIKTLPIVADVTRAEDVHRMFEEACSKLGEIEILVNNAGIGIFGPVHERSESDWDAVLNTNLKSVFLTSQAVVPRMIRQGRGHIVSVICPGSVATDFSSHVGRNPSTLLHPDDVAHAVAMLVAQSPRSFISEVDVRPLRKA